LGVGPHPGTVGESVSYFCTGRKRLEKKRLSEKNEKNRGQKTKQNAPDRKQYERRSKRRRSRRDERKRRRQREKLRLRRGRRKPVNRLWTHQQLLVSKQALDTPTAAGQCRIFQGMDFFLADHTLLTRAEPSWTDDG